MVKRAYTYEHHLGWCLQCTNEHHFLVLRFLQILLLRLSFNFAVLKTSGGNCNHLECTLWKNGIRWLHLNGIKTTVEFVEDRKAIVVLIRFTGQSLMNGLHLRSAVVRKVLDTKKLILLSGTHKRVLHSSRGSESTSWLSCYQ